MSRAPRIEVPGGIYHVGAKGNRGCSIYADAYAAQIFLKLLDRVTMRFGWGVFTYCLMSNHYHLIVQIGAAGLSDGMRQLNGEFARFTNARSGLEGHLFRNRFWDKLIDDDAQLLQTVRYVVLNPVRAGLCRAPEEWRWSSYRSCTGLDFAPPFLAVNALLQRFGASPQAARRAYRNFVRDGMNGQYRGAVAASRCQTP